MQLQLASNVSLPLDAATQTFLIVGKRGSGKSNTAVRLAEQLHRAKVPFAALDPVDCWYGLKAGADGRREGGLDVYVFGGAHADLPLEPTAGALMADVLVEHRISAVFVIREFSNREKARFVSAFADQLFRRNREVLHLFCEEAHEVMPQQPYKGEEEMLGRMLKLQKLGRSSGIGLTSLTQRPASLNKNATTQAEILIAHRLLGPQDRHAIEEWIKYHHMQEQKQEVLETLALLKTGEAWVWAPDFPEDRPLGLRRVHVAKAETFDSRQTPKPGERRPEPKQVLPVDLERLRSQMAATIERVKAEDPKALRAEIARLTAALQQAHHRPPPAPTKDRRVEVPVLKDHDYRRLEKLMAQAMALAEQYKSLSVAIGAEGSRLSAAVAMARDTEAAPRGSGTRVTTPSGGDPRGQPPSVSVRTATHTGALTGPQQRILDALAWLESLGQTEAEQVAVAFLAGYTVGGGAFNNPRGSLHSQGLLIYRGGRLALTAQGRALAQAPEAVLTSQDLQRHVLERLPGPERKLLSVLLAVYPQSLTCEELAKRAGYEPGGGAFHNPRGRLRSLGLVDYPERGVVVAQPVLFLEGRSGRG